MEPMNNARKPSQHRVLMNFMARRGWHISFLEQDCHTPLPRKLTFASADKIFEIHDRWAEHPSEATRSDLERSIEMGRPGSVWLLLTEEQYRKLK